ncbi:MAG: DUF3322 domain-containing protein [Rhodoferax sp.]|uniref:DUF3322 domain-containing protein n=1 Tax=Rhodoferax sp. TaxID=50421 RepID=UPI003262D2BC
MSWTKPADLRAQVQKLWDKGLLLQTPFPLRLRLVGPTSTELAERFAEATDWVAQLHRLPQLRIVRRSVNHRVLGQQTLPAELWLDTLDAALALVGKQPDAQRLRALAASTPAVLQPWLHKRPLAALGYAAAWPRLLAVLAWLQAHPRPGIYLRQVDIPGVDSKFIEAHRGVLAELFDLALPAEAIDASTTTFARRYGFTDKPLRIRFRLLDGQSAFGSDVGITQAAFEQLDLPITRFACVFITENETNFLAFPPVPGSIVVFGAGYGFEVLAGAAWLQQCSVFYWGDIDTHGFAILDQLRARLPHAQSLLMDYATLTAHADHWGTEPTLTLRDLPRLTVEEGAVYDALRTQHLGMRLEQERVGYEWLQRALAVLA